MTGKKRNKYPLNDTAKLKINRANGAEELDTYMPIRNLNTLYPLQEFT